MPKPLEPETGYGGDVTQPEVLVPWQRRISWSTWAAARLYATALGIFGCFAFWVLVCSADDSPLRKALSMGMHTMQENWIPTLVFLMPLVLPGVQRTLDRVSKIGGMELTSASGRRPDGEAP